MNIKPIRTQEDHEDALREIEHLFDAEPGTPEGDKLDVLVTLVDAYENKLHAIPLPDPIEAIEYHMERLGLTRKDLEQFIGGPSHVSEILNRKRPLSLRMIRSLSQGLGIPIKVLAQVYETTISGEDANAGLLSWQEGIPIVQFSTVTSESKVYLATAGRRVSWTLAETLVDKPDSMPSSSGTLSKPVVQWMYNATNATERIQQ